MDWKEMARALRNETERLQEQLKKSPGATSTGAISAAILVLYSLQIAIEFGSSRHS
jgi:hypothetical protein